MTPAEEIKAKLNVVDVLRDYLPLKAVGTNFQARCPFHNEKTASFVVSPAKQIWHCFGCDKGGDIFTFVQEIEHLSFPEVLRLLAPKAGVQLKQQDYRLTADKNRWLDALEAATDFYHHYLMTRPEAAAARDYAATRGLDEATLEAWQIGYAPAGWDGLLNFLQNKKFAPADLLAAGLVIHKAETNRYFDRFRGRLMFPIRDHNGNPVGFTARQLPGNQDGQAGKYINSPQSKVYDKSALLFGLDKAKMAIKESGYVIIMEGQMDCITAHQFGFKNVVATSGTALTELQVTLLKRHTDNFMFALDADTAGQNAIDRASALINALDYKEVEAADRYGRPHIYIDPESSYQINIKVLEIVAGKDPDELIRQDKRLFAAAIAAAKPLMQYIFDKTLARFDLAQVSGQQQAVKILLPLLARSGDRVAQNFWLNRLAERLSMPEKFLREELEKLPKKPTDQNRSNNVSPVTKLIRQTRDQALSEFLVALLFKSPKDLARLANFLTPEQLVGPSVQDVYKNLIIYYYKNQQQPDFSFSYQAFSSWLGVGAGPETVAAAGRLAVLGEKEFYQLNEAEANQEIFKISRQLKKQYLAGRQKEITRLLAQLEEKIKSEPSAENKRMLDDALREFNDLAKELRQLSD